MQVVIKSPIPAIPENVFGFAPNLTPNFVSSYNPLVISEAFELEPKPRPSEMPVAIAIIFFNAPHNSTPTRSSFV